MKLEEIKTILNRYCHGKECHVLGAMKDPNPGEVIVEMERDTNRSIEVAFLEKPVARINQVACEFYSVLEGMLWLIRNNEAIILKPGKTAIIRPGTVYQAQGIPAAVVRIECDPAWLSPHDRQLARKYHQGDSVSHWCQNCKSLGVLDLAVVLDSADLYVCLNDSDSPFLQARYSSGRPDTSRAKKDRPSFKHLPLALEHAQIRAIEAGYICAQSFYYPPTSTKS